MPCVQSAPLHGRFLCCALFQGALFLRYVAGERGLYRAEDGHRKRESRGAGIRGVGNLSFLFLLPVWKTDVLPLRFLEEEFFLERGWRPVFSPVFSAGEGDSHIFLREHGGTPCAVSVLRHVVLHRQKKLPSFCPMSAGKGCRRLKKKGRAGGLLLFLQGSTF